MSEGKDEKSMTIRVKALENDVLSAYWRLLIAPMFHSLIELCVVVLTVKRTEIPRLRSYLLLSQPKVIGGN